MLTIIVKGGEQWDEANEVFIYPDDVVLELEHSLISLSKWESKFSKPFLGPISDKTNEEIYAYIEMMILNKDHPPEVMSRLSQENLDAINDYIGSNQSATTFSESMQQKAQAKAEIVTSELIYFWMVSYQVQIEAETWHLNRLFSLLRICNIKNSKPKKMSRNEMAIRNKQLNAERRAKYNTSG